MRKKKKILLKIGNDHSSLFFFSLKLNDFPSFWILAVTLYFHFSAVSMICLRPKYVLCWSANVRRQIHNNLVPIRIPDPAFPNRQVINLKSINMQPSQKALHSSLKKKKKKIRWPFLQQDLAESQWEKVSSVPPLQCLRLCKKLHNRYGSMLLQYQFRYQIFKFFFLSVFNIHYFLHLK